VRERERTLPCASPGGRLGPACALLLAMSVAGCAATRTDRYPAAGDGVLCEPGATLGTVAVLPETAWRADQKDVPERVAMARRAIAAAVAGLPCGSLDPPGGVRGFDAWSSHPEAGVLIALAAAGVDTAVFVRIEELTPRLMLTFSLPFLWSGSSEADFRVRAVRTDSGEVLEDLRVRRSRAGPFNLRPASWSETELREALRGVLGPRPI